MRALGAILDNPFSIVARFLSPPPGVLEAFTKTATPLCDLIIQNASQSRTLAQLRDTLLPKLISGEIRIKAVEKFLEART